MTDNFNSANYFVWSYTDKDFEDTDKVNNFLNETDRIIEEYDRLPELSKKIINVVLPEGWRDEIIAMQNHAIDVNLDTIKEKNKCNKTKCDKTKCTCNKNKTNSTTHELAEKYVNTEVINIMDKCGINFSDKQKEDLICAYDAFAKWILEQ